jgi:hypothetical protein
VSGPGGRKVDEGETIFQKSLGWKIRSMGGVAEERYDERPLETLLRENYFGETKMSDAVTEMVLTSYDLHSSAPFIFKRSYAREKREWDYAMWKVARATSAAPTYFEPFESGRSTSRRGRPRPRRTAASLRTTRRSAPMSKRLTCGDLRPKSSFVRSEPARNGIDD